MLAYEFDKTDTGQLIDPDHPLLFGDKMQTLDILVTAVSYTHLTLPTKRIV